MMMRQNRFWIFALIAIAAVIILTIFAAPDGNKVNSGSTYGRNPDGYGAWYEYMSERGTPVIRWQKPLSKFIANHNSGVTYIQIRGKEQFQLSSLLTHQLKDSAKDWLNNGNTLVIVGEFQPVTAAPFSSLLSQDNFPKIKIQTTRRKKPNSKIQIILEDSFGAVVWQETVGDGKIIYLSTPYLAANAYQEFPDNYKFLAELVSKTPTIFVDEYLHGYKDRETIAQEEAEDLFNYLAQTPLFLLLIQLIIMALVAIASEFRRFGKPINLTIPIVDNSMAYIKALAGILAKAESTDFVVQTIGRDEQLKLQRSLGLGKTLVDRQTLTAAWQKHTGKPATELNQLLQVFYSQKRLSQSELSQWNEKWQTINSASKGN